MVCFDTEGSSLIFLISLPQGSGAMLREMLGNHRDIHAPLEPCVVLQPLLAMKSQGQGEECGSPWMRAALNAFVKGLPAGDRDYLDALRAMASVLYGRSLAGSRKRVFLDSTTPNLRAVHELRSVFPKAGFVLLVRNPVTVLLSALINSFDADVEAFRRSRCYREIVLGISDMQAAITSLGQAATVVHFEDLQSKTGEILELICSRHGLAQDLAVGTCCHESHCRGDQSLTNMIGQETSISRWQILKRFALEELERLGAATVRILGYDYQQIREDIEVSRTPGLAAVGIPAVELNRLGEDRFTAGDVDAARRLFVQVLETEPRNSDALNNLAIIHATRGEIQESLKLLTEVLRIDPGHCEAAANLAVISAASRASHEVCPDRITHLDANTPGTRAKDDLDCIKHSVDMPSAMAGDLNRLGEELFSSGDFEGAMARFLEAHERAPDDATVCNNLGVLFGHMGGTEDALLHTARAIELDPCNETFVSNAVKLRIDSGRVQEALAICANHVQDCAGIVADQDASRMVHCGDGQGARAL